MHLSLSVVLAVTLFVGIECQGNLESPAGLQPFFDRPAGLPPFPSRPPPLQTRLGGLFSRFDRPNRLFRYGRPAFLNSNPNGELLLPLGPPVRRGVFGGQRRGPPSRVFSPFDLLGQIPVAADDTEKTEDRSLIK